MALAAFCRTRVVHPRAQLFVYYLQPPMLLAGGDSEQCRADEFRALVFAACVSKDVCTKNAPVKMVDGSNKVIRGNTKILKSAYINKQKRNMDRAAFRAELMTHDMTREARRFSESIEKMLSPWSSSSSTASGSCE